MCDTLLVKKDIHHKQYTTQKILIIKLLGVDFSTYTYYSLGIVWIISFGEKRVKRVAQKKRSIRHKKEDRISLNTFRMYLNIFKEKISSVIRSRKGFQKPVSYCVTLFSYCVTPFSYCVTPYRGKIYKLFYPLFHLFVFHISVRINERVDPCFFIKRVAFYMFFLFQLLEAF